MIKNTLALRAVNESGLVSQSLKGPTGVVVAKDGVTAAKVLTDFAKENEQRPSVKGGIYEGKSIDDVMVKRACHPFADGAPAYRHARCVHSFRIARNQRVPPGQILAFVQAPIRARWRQPVDFA